MRAGAMTLPAIVLSGLVLALVACGGDGSSAETTPPATTAAAAIDTTAAAHAQSTFTAADCATLGTVLSDIKIDSHTDWNFAYDIFPTDYARDRDTLNGLSGSTSSGDELDQLGAFLDAYASAAQEAGVETRTIPATQEQASTVWQSVGATGVRSIELQIAIRALTRWVAGGCSAGGPPSGGIEPPPSATTTTTKTTATVAAVEVGDTATWRGDAFTVSDVDTSDTSPIADLLGKKAEAKNGVWLSFKITPAEDDSAIWLADFTDNIQIRGGDGVVYDDQDSSHNNAGEQHELGEGDFLVGIDIPEEAVSGAVLEINDGLYPRNYSVAPTDPAAVTRVDLGL
jgi:hypothetical protein